MTVATVPSLTSLTSPHVCQLLQKCATPLPLARVALSPTATVPSLTSLTSPHVCLPAASLPGSNRLWIHPKNADPVRSQAPKCVTFKERRVRANNCNCIAVAVAVRQIARPGRSQGSRAVQSMAKRCRRAAVSAKRVRCTCQCRLLAWRDEPGTTLETVPVIVPSSFRPLQAILCALKPPRERDHVHNGPKSSTLKTGT